MGISCGSKSVRNRNGVGILVEKDLREKWLRSRESTYDDVNLIGRVYIEHS